jgi:PAS domain S-box-containing protein
VSPAAQEPASSVTEPVPILLVDDSPANLLALEAVLASSDHELVSARSGREAIQRLKDRDFAVVLLDLQMPEMDGFETAQTMKRIARRGQPVPIIFLTGIDGERSRILRAYAEGAVDFIQKPVEPEVIRAKVGVFAELYRARQRVALEQTKADEERLRSAKEGALRRAAETRSSEVEERFRLLVGSVSDYAIFMLDPDGHVVTWNVGAQRIKGYAANEIIGRSFKTFYPQEDVAAGKCEYELAVATRDGRYGEEGWRIRKDGSRFWANVTITALRNQEHALVGFAKVTRDLTERMRSEQQLRHLAAQNAALEATASFEKAQQARRDFLAQAGEALVSSLDYRTTLSTVARLTVPALADWCSVQLIEPGASAPSPVAVVHADPGKVEFARALTERYPPDPDAPTGVPEVIRSGKSELYTEIPGTLLEARAVDGEHLRLLQELRLESAVIVPLTGRDRVLGAMSFIYAGSGRRYTESDLAFAQDFARRAAMAIENAQAHAEVSAALEFRERFVAVLGHDLRNPLSAIDMAEGVLRQRAANADDHSTLRVLDRLKSSSSRMSRMIEQVLDLTRSRLAGGLPMNPGAVDLRDILTGIVDELRMAHPSRSIDLRCPPVHGTWDRDRLEQVFSNLIVNAVHYGVAEKPVTVRARLVDDGTVLVDVHNEGDPIPEDLRAELFNPFRRGNRDGRSPKTAGLGLGLYISREIVVAHGGRLDVESSHSGGTTFQVMLPGATLAPAEH